MTRQPDLTVQGVLGTNPVLSRTEGGRAYCRFRVAVTPSYRTEQGWQDAGTIWFTAKAWGRLAENLSLSLRKGDPVLLTGRLSEETWSTSEGTHSSNVIMLWSVGHDLTRGESRFARVRAADVPSAPGIRGEGRSPGGGTAGASESSPGHLEEEAGEADCSSRSTFPDSRGVVATEVAGPVRSGHTVLSSPDYVVADTAASWDAETALGL
ncbi:single-stranded DNA-binding protein [Actinomyces sp. 2119]|uniref:Single-stranded DNA-binding protein n=1 Tax=Actinomyces lilanjuaniae TaxID=2321394 RepID=A0ABM6Z4L7_9ACTO|nr:MULTISPECIES: single-stranded DNA-binding protein [Actinomyces]AYD90093.1 single-stranded DNA-binding protein [Actinomyces lilanjuaniae]RJF42602.1 single-stranded DNA-binding protein [Actinomyces sp. 2119]